ncbi:hypothetical protein BHE74_00002816 [Ensete ventricosum]|nr:hypothetical protein GW17_00007127 [Ensete ventricosum]RWW88313.1 hypothetical protein BHE74_00002816 [Ensete ventricosum]
MALYDSNRNLRFMIRANKLISSKRPVGRSLANIRKPMSRRPDQTLDRSLPPNGLARIHRPPLDLLRQPPACAIPRYIHKPKSPPFFSLFLLCSIDPGGASI